MSRRKGRLRNRSNAQWFVSVLQVIGLGMVIASLLVTLGFVFLQTLTHFRGK
jgi:hypothetical protein